MEQNFRVWEQAAAQVAARAVPGSRLVRAWELSGGISTHMMALELALGDSRRKLVVRVPGEGALRSNPRAAQDEFAVLEWAAGQGLAVPRPVSLDTSAEVLPQPYFVMEWIEGEPVFALPAGGEAAQSLAEQAADALVAIHRAGLPGEELAFLPRRVGACVESGEGQGWALPAGPALAAMRVANHSKANPTAQNDWAAQNDRAAENDRAPQYSRGAQYSRVPQPYRGPQYDRGALLHGDFWPGNLLWQNGRLVAVVDWEDAALGDPLADFAIARLDFLWIYGREVFEAFTRRYQSQIFADYSGLPYWDLCAALRLARLVGEDLDSWAAFFAPYGRTDITPGSIREYYDWFVRQAVSAFDGGV